MRPPPTAGGLACIQDTATAPAKSSARLSVKAFRADAAPFAGQIPPLPAIAAWLAWLSEFVFEHMGVDTRWLLAKNATQAATDVVAPTPRQQDMARTYSAPESKQPQAGQELAHVRKKARSAGQETLQTGLLGGTSEA